MPLSILSPQFQCFFLNITAQHTAVAGTSPLCSYLVCDQYQLKTDGLIETYS